MIIDRKSRIKVILNLELNVNELICLALKLFIKVSSNEINIEKSSETFDYTLQSSTRPPFFLENFHFCLNQIKLEIRRIPFVLDFLVIRLGFTYMLLIFYRFFISVFFIIKLLRNFQQQFFGCKNRRTIQDSYHEHRYP